MGRRLALGILAGCSLASIALLAATFDELAGVGTATGSAAPARVIRMTGTIEEGDAVRLRRLLTEIQKGPSRRPGASLATIELSSLGGDLIEGMKLGYMFREFDVATVVRAGDLCLSSCALAFLGGTARRRPTELTAARTVEVGGTLGFHNFWLNPNHERARDASSPSEGIAKGFNEGKGAASRLVHYAASLGVDAAFIGRLLGRPPEVWDYTETAGEFIDLKICPAGLVRSPPAPPRRALNICGNLLGEAGLPTASAVPPRVRQMTTIEAKRHLIGHVQKNIAESNVRGALAKQLATVLASRDDKLVDVTYADLRALGLVLPDILGPTFEISGYSFGELDMECVVSLSSDDPDRFDAVIKGAGGFIRPARPGPPACGRVLTFDRSDIINPGKS